MMKRDVRTDLGRVHMLLLIKNLSFNLFCADSKGLSFETCEKEGKGERKTRTDQDSLVPGVGILHHEWRC